MTVRGIVGGAIRFVRDHPVMLIVWSAINLVLGVAMRVIMAPIYQARLAALTAGTHPQMPSFGSFVPVWIGIMAVMIILYTAVFRAVLFPEERRFAYLRIGLDELRLLGLIVVLGAGFALAWMAMLIVGGLAIAAAGTVLGFGRQTMIPVALLLFFILWCGLAFIAVRLLPAQPLTLLRRKIIIGEAWRLTRGHFWRLLGAFLILFLLIAIVSLIPALPQMGPVFSAMSHPGNPDMQLILAEVQARQFSLHPSPAMVAQILVGSVIGAAMLLLLASAMAIATRMLLDERTGRSAEVQPAPASGPWG